MAKILRRRLNAPFWPRADQGRDRVPITGRGVIQLLFERSVPFDKFMYEERADGWTIPSPR
jgi:hypothetical protein